jgi:hypothetical protein
MIGHSVVAICLDNGYNGLELHVLLPTSIAMMVECVTSFQEINPCCGHRTVEAGNNLLGELCGTHQNGSPP